MPPEPPQGRFDIQTDLCDDGTMKVIFLDVDGVLITGMKPYDWRTPDPTCIALLNELTECTHGQIVVSSCWRVGRTLPELRDLFKRWGVIGTIIDRTGSGAESRGLEIMRWLHERDKLRGDVDKFVIIDDDKDMDVLFPSLVQTKHHLGLTEPDVKKAIELLS